MKVALTTAQYERLRLLLARAAGLVFDESRRESLSYSVGERLRATGLPDAEAYLAALTDPVERQHLLDEVTIQETHFFRNPPQIRALRDHVLPELLRHGEQHGRRLRVWSAGCSTGEEPYTLAMLLRGLLPSTAGWDVRVLATDLSERALTAARTGRYGRRAVQLASPQQLSRFFTATGDGGYQVRPEVRDLVEFRRHNLVTDPVPAAAGEALDLVLCRNVTIYFSRETTRALMGRLHAGLRDGGFLFLGHSETLWRVSEQFRLVALGAGDTAAFVYRRQDAPGTAGVVLPERGPRADGVPAPGPQRRGTERRPVDPVLLRQPPAGTVKALLAAARARLAAGAYDEAALLAAEAVAADPLRAEACYLRGRALVAAGRDGEALVDLRKAVYLQPGAGFAHFLLAGVLARLGHQDAAAREYAAAADTLGGQPEDEGSDELGGRQGRSVRELVELSRQLSGGQLSAERVR